MDETDNFATSGTGTNGDKRKLHAYAVKNQSLRETVHRLRRQVEFLEEKQQELQELVNHDPYTGLPIRRVFDRRLDERFRVLSAETNSHRMMALGVIRLDKRYARIKNSRDRNKILLFKTTARIKEIIGDNLFQSDRLDEFHIMLNNMPNLAAVELICEKIAEEVARPQEEPADDVSFGCYLGVSVYPLHGSTRDELLGNADIALERCEKLDRPFIIYDEEMGREHRDRELIESELATAVETSFEQFHIAYQPFVDPEGRIIGAEALMRWHHPTLGTVPPPVFIPIAEQTGDIRILGHWILYNACRELTVWHHSGFPDLYISVNLSPHQFKQRDLVARITGILQALNLEGRHLKLELTESMVMDDPDDAIQKMVELKQIGVRLSIDDFGTGYSSLNYLRKLPIDMVKIDKSFIDDVDRSVPNQEIVKGIISLVHTIRIDCLAEGVETKEQMELLFSEGCNAIQGYYFSRPVDNLSFRSYLTAGGLLPAARLETAPKGEESPLPPDRVPGSLPVGGETDGGADDLEPAPVMEVTEDLGLL
ncbi:putative bifunctional diguanylate cyclase/phosphodiesterase [Salinispira pacifica]